MFKKFIDILLCCFFINYSERLRNSDSLRNSCKHCKYRTFILKYNHDLIPPKSVDMCTKRVGDIEYKDPYYQIPRDSDKVYEIDNIRFDCDSCCYYCRNNIFSYIRIFLQKLFYFLLVLTGWIIIIVGTILIRNLRL